MRIVIASPSSKTEVSEFLDSKVELPKGYEGANFIGALIFELLKQGHEVTAVTIDTSLSLEKGILSFSKGVFTWKVIAARKNAYRFNKMHLGRIIDLLYFERKQIIKVIKEVNPDIVHAHWAYEFSLAAITSKYPCLVTVHDNPFKVLRYSKTLYRFLRLLMADYAVRKANFISTVSPYMLSFCKKRNKNCRIVPNPLPPKFKIASEPKKLNDAFSIDNPPIISMVINGWGKLKNGTNGLLAFKLIKEKFPCAELWLFGNGSEVGGVAEKMCSKFQISSVKFNGMVTHEVLKGKINKSHLVLHPSLEESFGVAIIEAMVLGVPIIGGMNSGAVPWVINNLELLTNVNEPKEIANKAIGILSNPPLYNVLSNFCINNAINRFSSEMVTNEYIKYYNFILGN
jgi:L-malate glycosyltransferase